MNNKYLIAISAAACIALSGSQVFAKGPNYTYTEAGYNHVDGDLVEGDGGSVNISYGATDHIFVIIDYSRLFLEDTMSPGEFDADRFRIGGGGHMAVTDNIDALGSVSYVDIEFSNTRGGLSGASADDGYLVEVGVRAMLTKKAELNATISSLHLDGDDDTGYGIGGVYNFYKRYSVTGNYRLFEDDDEGEFFIGLRYRL